VLIPHTLTSHVYLPELTQRGLASVEKQVLVRDLGLKQGVNSTQ